MQTDKKIESHPWPAYIPPGARILIMGTFPPPRKRWAMDFYYPNRTNDFWKIMGLIFENDVYAYYNPETRNYDLPAIKEMLNRKKIALNDTGYRVHRQKENASDKYLEIIEPVDLQSLLKEMPECKTIATTGEKAAGVIASLTRTEAPKMGECIESSDGLIIWRMPSTSRAYPLALEKKAQYYRTLFESVK